MSQRIEPIKADIETLEKAETEALSKKKLQVYGSIVLAITFLLLLINFILFSSLNADNIKLAYRVSSTARTSSDIKSIQDSIKSKELELQLLGWDNGVSKARLVDQMASCLPQEVTWKLVDINPVDNNESRAQRTLIFKNRQIKIAGLSDKVIPVNEWIARIKTQHWVKDVTLDNYVFNSEANTGQFTISVSY
jgi:Tfp pilus assembly protein PilN